VPSVGAGPSAEVVVCSSISSICSPGLLLLAASVGSMGDVGAVASSSSSASPGCVWCEDASAGGEAGRCGRVSEDVVYEMCASVRLSFAQVSLDTDRNAVRDRTMLRELPQRAGF